MAAGTIVTVTFVGIRLPYCPISNLLFTVTVRNGGFAVEKGSASMTTATYTAETVAPLPIATNSSYSTALNTITYEFAHTNVLPRNAYILLILPSTATYLPGSTCTFIGLEATAACAVTGANTIRVNNGIVLAERLPGAGTIKITINLFSNPKGLGTFPIPMEIYTSTNCRIATGTQNQVIDLIPDIQAVSLIIPKMFRNIYQTYTFEITPNILTWNNGDGILIELPLSHHILNTATCNFLSTNNINNIACTRQANNIMLVVPTVTQANYSTDKKLIFRIDYIRNPDTVGLSTGYAIKLVSAADNSVFESMSTSLTKTFTGFTTPVSSDMQFETKLVGEKATTSRLAIKLDSFVEKDSFLVIQYSDKFDITEDAVIRSSSPQFTHVSTDKALRKVTLKLVANSNPDTEWVLSLRLSNPATMIASSDAVAVSILTTNSLTVVQGDAPIKSAINFVCDAFCTGCNRFYKECTVCVDTHEISGTTCTKKIKSEEAQPPFIFLTIAGILTVWMLFVGLICGCRNYWGNFLFSILQFNFLAFCGFYGYNLWINDTEAVPRYIIIAAGGCHLLLSWLYFFKIKAELNNSKYASKYCKKPEVEIKDTDKKSAKELLQEAILKETINIDEKRNEEEIEAEFKGMLNVFMILSLLFSPTVVRWFFSEKGNKKGYLWYFAIDNFIEVKNKFEWFQALHLLLVIFPLIGANAWVLYPIVPRLWYRYMVEMVSLCVLHILIYIIAFLELWSAKDKITAAEKIEKEKEMEIKAKYGDKISDQSVVQGLLDQTNPLSHSHKEIIVGNAAMIPNNSFMEQGKGNELRRSELEIMKPIQIHGSPAKNPYLVNNPASTPNQKTKEQMMGIQRTTVDHQVLVPTRMDSFDPKPKQESPKKPYQDKLTPMNKAIRYAEVKLVPEKGVLRPKLEVVNKAPKNNFKDAGKNTNVGTENTRQIVRTDENNEKVFEYPSTKINLDESNIKAPEKSRFKENQLFSKWWFGNSTKKYLEIIYEEDESTAKINENPEYDEPDREAIYNQEFPKLGHLDAEKQELYIPKEAQPRTDIKMDTPSNMNFEIKPKKQTDIFPEIEENLSVVGNPRLINGQDEGDILSGQLKDRNGQELILDEQDERAMQEGTYYDTQNRKILLNTQNPSLFNKGLIKDIDGVFHRLKDQDLDLMSKGVMLKRTGSVENINGQNPQDIDRQMLYDRDGRKLDLVKQSPDCFEKGVFKVDDNMIVPTSEKQNPNKMMLGLITAPNGKDYRIKDQYFDEIAANQQYRDRNLRPIVGPQPSSSYFDKQQSLMDEQLRKIQELEKQPLLDNPLQNTSSYARTESEKDGARPKPSKPGFQEPSTENLKKPMSVKSTKSIKPAMKQQAVRFDGQASRDSLYPIGYEPRESDGRRVTEEDEIDSMKKSTMNPKSKNGPKVQIKDFEYDEKPAEKRKAPIVSITEKSKNNRSSIRSEKPLQKNSDKVPKKSPTSKNSLKDVNQSKESLLKGDDESEVLNEGEEEDAKKTENGSLQNIREEMEKAVEYEQEDSEENDEYGRSKKPTVAYVSNHNNKPKPTSVDKPARPKSPVVSITQPASRKVPPLRLDKPSESTVRDPRDTGTIKEVPHSRHIPQPAPDSFDPYDIGEDEVLGGNRDTPPISTTGTNGKKTLKTTSRTRRPRSWSRTSTPPNPKEPRTLRTGPRTTTTSLPP
jgi:hypothetical protein